MYSQKMSTDPKNGIFIDYLFRWEDHEVLLTLLQGVDGKLKDCPDKIDNIKKLVQTKIDCASFSKSMSRVSPVTNGTLSKSKRNRAKSYANGIIFHKKYTSSSLPESRRLEADLNEIIRIYDKVKRLEIK